MTVMWIMYGLLVRRWFLTDNFIYIMHFTIGICCVVAMWAVLCLFAARLARAVGSGKRWSPRRRAMCTYTAALVAMQVEHSHQQRWQQHSSVGGITHQPTLAPSGSSLCSIASMQCGTVGTASGCISVNEQVIQAQLLVASQALNTLCYVAANTIILFGHCLWYAPSVLWLGFIRWEVRTVWACSGGSPRNVHAHMLVETGPVH